MSTRDGCIVALNLILSAWGAPVAGQIESIGKVTLTGGAHAGSYTIQSPTPCDIRKAAAGSPAEFRADVGSEESIRYPLRAKPGVISWIRVRVRDLDAGHRNELHVMITFGDPTNRRTPGTLYEMDTTPLNGGDSMVARGTGRPLRTSSGKGTAAMRNDGKVALLTFKGETEQGVRVDGSVECLGNS